MYGSPARRESATAWNQGFEISDSCAQIYYVSLPCDLCATAMIMYSMYCTYISCTTPILSLPPHPQPFTLCHQIFNPHTFSKDQTLWKLPPWCSDLIWLTQKPQEYVDLLILLHDPEHFKSCCTQGKWLSHCHLSRDLSWNRERLMIVLQPLISSLVVIFNL